MPNLAAVQLLSFAGEEAKKYEVGNNIPTLDFKVKNSWAGEIAFETPNVKNASIFFWLWGRDDINPGEDLVIWLNGGPGCTSLLGMVQENGPFLHQSVKDKPYPNGWSWTKGVNMLYIDQPAGVGFSEGRTYYSNETQVASDFAAFLDEFWKVFPELKSMNLWIAAESYGGVYAPGMMHKLYNDGKTPQLQGAMIVDGVVTSTYLSRECTIYQYANQHKETLNFTDLDLQDIKNEGDSCGTTNYVEQNLHYPPQYPLPDFNISCSPYNMFRMRAQEARLDFDVYNIKRPYDENESPLGEVNTWTALYHHDTFFDNVAIQDYIHAPHKKWVSCKTIFYNGDNSNWPDKDPDQQSNHVSESIEKSKKFLILNGNLDALIITNGTALGLQNLTWNNGTGFSKPPLTPLYDLEGYQAGSFVEERGLTFAQVYESGHMIPYDQPPYGYTALLHLIGKRDWTQK
ncbi:alpha/beta-hydrolase [Meira miltonrushii]|uniref:Carboxypeptidase n=1 Tax=Meira miltonrushii TaxID=1280837 RepID=A0A316V920_9BASI|nr:alpha/beta-hydrolase [Meira miltonrushii]PWN32961.1 alpha/beta-hydrolase [Meira miltonrushii]